MKRLLFFSTIIIILSAISLQLHAATCNNPIDLIGLPSAIIQSKISDSLQNYSAHLSGDRYELCFKMEELTVGTDTSFDSFLITPAVDETKDIYITGLKIKHDITHPVDIPIIIVRNRGKGRVILQDIALKNVHNGISVEKGNHLSKLIPQTIPHSVKGVVQDRPRIEIKKSIIQGDANKIGTCVNIKVPGVAIQTSEISSCDEGIRIAGTDALVEGGSVRDSNFCINIVADDAKVRGVEISGCGEGIGIEANNALIGAADHANAIKPHSDMNDIHDNVMGLHVVSGQYNKFGFNLIHHNRPQSSIVGTAGDAITIEDNSNENLPPLEAILYKEEGVQYALKCVRDKNGSVIGRSLLFNVPQSAGLISVFAVKKDSQPMQYIASCAVKDEGVCDITNLSADVLQMIPEGKCGLDDYYINAIFTGTSSTELMTEFEILDGVVAFVSNPYDIPTTGGASDVDIASGVDEEISEESASENSIGAGGAAIEGSGAALASAASGCGGGGASLANNSFRTVVFSFNAWWVILILALAGTTRLAAVRIRSRRRDR
jgi:hypothetical protein